MSDPLMLCEASPSDNGEGRDGRSQHQAKGALRPGVERADQQVGRAIHVKGDDWRRGLSGGDQRRVAPAGVVEAHDAGRRAIRRVR